MNGADPVSIKKIAEIVGVSYSTVSRVLSNPGYKCSSDELRKKIFDTARQLNYVPNEAARNLKLGAENGNTIYRIGILETRTESAEVDPFFNELMSCVESEIHKNMCIVSGIWYKPVFSADDQFSGNDSTDIASEICGEEGGGLDGLIIIGKCAPAMLKALKKVFRNIVSINRNSTNYEVDEVTCDGKKIAAAAVEYLIKLGHRHIGYVGDCHSEARFDGYRETMFRYNLIPDVDCTIEVKQSEEHGYRAMERLVQYKDPPTGIYCANDIIAIGMIRCLNRYRNRYYTPSIISSDDIEEARNTKPLLTTVRLPREDMAKFAVYLLLDKIKGGHKAVTRIELEGHLVIRESCSAADNALGCEYVI